MRRVTASNRDAAAVSVLGTLADGVVGSGGSRGLLRVDTAGIEIDWWVGADDSWRVPSSGDVHTIRPGVAPAIEARVRVPGGEVVLRAYAVAGEDAPLVVAELENASPAPVALAWVVRAAPGYRIGRAAIDGSTLLIDERARVELPGAPLRWAVDARAAGVYESVVGGNAASGRFDSSASGAGAGGGRHGDVEIALLFPVAHRTRTRIAATVAGARATAVAVARLPSFADVERGWVAALDRGMRVELPDEPMQAAVDAARATLLLGLGSRTRRDRFVSRISRSWGLADAPARRRFRAVSHERDDDPWPGLRASVTTPAASGATPRRAAEWLGALRGALVHVERGRVDLLPHFPVEWLGLPVAVHDAPTRHGPVSFALRWHDLRPALLWDVPANLRVGAPALDRSWQGLGGAGEALLAEIDPTRLLPLGTTIGTKPGTKMETKTETEPSATPDAILDEPGSFT
jgi:hypothetical protein